jgi:transcription elongation factor GreA
MNQPTQTWLTQEAADRLTAELAELEGPLRAEIIKKIETARAEGDLKENGGYHAAREEQGKIEGRIRQLKHMLEHAHIGTPPAGESGVVGLGMLVTVDIAGDEIKLGAAVLGAKVGQTVTYTAPTGKQIQVAVLEAQPFS